MTRHMLPGVAETESDRPEYEPPALVDLGSAEELTANGSTSNTDGFTEGSVF